MDVFPLIRKWLSQPMSRVIVPAGSVCPETSRVSVRLCLGQLLVIPGGLLHGDTLADLSTGGGEARAGDRCVTLRLADSIAPLELDFLNRLVSVAVRLSTWVQGASADPSLLERRISISDAPVHFVFQGSSDGGAGPEGNYLVSLGDLPEVAVPATLVDLRRLEPPAHGAAGGFHLEFKPGSPLTSLANQLVRIIQDLARTARGLEDNPIGRP